MVNFSKRKLLLRQEAHFLPWLTNSDSFFDDCTQCQKCVNSCETKVIELTSNGYPTLNFTKNECSFCYQCAASCPEKLFSDRNEKPWNVIASINEQCLAKHNVECRSCSDACERSAITFQLIVGHSAQPNLDINECTGCGACVSICPSLAISITPQEAEIRESL
ncbi:ferredoxin-type protein NapF [Vibrio profundum]|uniref:ferredoxin-type protein NapF n=1 Tax=Vibrio profundum TaxID=2910247 RepID=UPI003D12D29C